MKQFIECLSVFSIMHLSMLSPRGGGSRADVEHLTSIAFPILGNLTKNLGPRVGTFAFLRGGIGTKSNRSGADVVLKDGWF